MSSSMPDNVGDQSIPITPDHEIKEPLVLVVGRPNAGKTSVFNRLTGHRLKTGNYHGVTVEHAEGGLTLGDRHVRLIDLPGSPSLIPTSPDEGLTADALLNHALGVPQAVIVVVDALRLLEGLYFALQVIELGKPTLVVVNQIDLAEAAGVSIDILQMSQDLNPSGARQVIHVLAASARTGQGFTELNEHLRELLEFNRRRERAPRDDLHELATHTQGMDLERDLPQSTSMGHPRWSWGDAPLERFIQAHPHLLEEVLSIIEDRHGSPTSIALDHRDAYLRWLTLAVTETEAPLSPKLRLMTLSALQEAEGDEAQRAVESFIKSRFSWLDQRAPLWIRRTKPAPQLTRTERIDRWLLHPFWGSLVFIGIMISLFQALFVGADPFIGLIEDGVAWLGEAASETLPVSIFSEFIIEGLINGVGNVIVFLPQVLILFGLIGIMEDSGYMARAAALTDRVMQAAGLSGRAFVPMLSGFICAVPAILATRTLPQRRDRLLTMMSLPLLTCSARLPVYTLLIATLLPESQSLLGIDQRAWVMITLYLFAVFTAFAAVWVMGRTILRGEAPPLLLHLPAYRRPVARDVLRHLGSRSWVFIKEAGSVIFAGTVVLWLLLTFPRDPLYTAKTAVKVPPKSPVTSSDQRDVIDVDRIIDATPRVLTLGAQSSAQRSSPEALATEAERTAQRRAQSYGGQLGRLMEPMLKPLGWDWQVGVGLIGAFAAREVFISTLGMVYGVGGEVTEESASLRERIKNAKHPDGRPVFTPISALALLIFFSLACQCMSTLAAVKRETGGYRWPMFMFGYMSALAYGCALLVTWIGRALG